MQNNFITKISPSIRILVLLILIISLLIAKSIYLISLITILVLILAIITDKKVNLYVKILKKIVLLLLILLVTYIIIFKQYSVFSIFICIYKLFVITLLFIIFVFNIDFSSIHQGLYGLFIPLKKLNIDIEKLSYDIVIAFYFMKILMTSKDQIKMVQKTRGIRIINIKNYVLPSLFYSINQLNKLQENLTIKLYKLNYKKINLRSAIVLILFLVLFIICIFKEVML